jgi:hypothetical protein
MNRPRKANWLPIIEGILVLGVLVFGGHYLLTSPQFNIRQIHIDGIQTVSTKRVGIAASIPPGKNVFAYLLQQRGPLCSRVESCDPAIADASLALQLPNTLVLNIVERQPYAVLHLQNGPSYLMDSDRCAYHMIAPNMSDLPIITVPAATGVIVEGKPLPQDTDDHVVAGFNLLDLLANRQIGPLTDFREVVVDPYDNVNLRLDNELLIKLGQPDGMPQRLADLETALTAKPSLISEAQYLDFTTSRYAIMKKPAPLTVLSGNEEQTGPITTITADIGH